MTESEYIQATSLAKTRAALEILRTIPEFSSNFDNGRKFLYASVHELEADQGRGRFEPECDECRLPAKGSRPRGTCECPPREKGSPK